LNINRPLPAGTKNLHKNGDPKGVLTLNMIESLGSKYDVTSFRGSAVKSIK
jgi:hypothetical protein